MYIQIRRGSLLQYSCLENLRDREAWWAIVYRLARVRHDLATEQQNCYYQITLACIWKILRKH